MANADGQNSGTAILGNEIDINDRDVTYDIHVGQAFIYLSNTGHGSRAAILTVLLTTYNARCHVSPACNDYNWGLTIPSLIL